MKCLFFLLLPLTLGYAANEAPEFMDQTKENSCASEQKVEVVDKAISLLRQAVDEVCFFVQKIELVYAPGVSAPIALEKLSALSVPLTSTSTGMIAAPSSPPPSSTPIHSLAGKVFYGSALIKIAQTVVSYFNSLGYRGVRVQVDPEQINNLGEDLRKDDKEPLRFLINTCRLQCINTIGVGPTGCGLNHQNHRRVLEYFPLRSRMNCGEECDACLLNCDEINDYVYRLNRYPGRKVNAEITGMSPDGDAELNLLITEEKPWYVYANISNTGTDATGHWIERFGYVNHQITRHDDTFAIEYATAHFSSMHSVSGYYEGPIACTNWLRWRVDGMDSTFNVETTPLLSKLFVGKQWRAGPSLIANIYQYNDFFLDVNAGIYWFHVTVDNHLINVVGKELFLLPTVGLSFERQRQSSTILGAVSFQTNLNGLAGTNPSQIDDLGRLNASVQWALIEGYFSASTYLASGQKESLPTACLSHELAIAVSGQYAFDYRLIPQKEGVVGGLYSVRGYSQAAAVGDSVVFARAEYRYHFPRPCGIDECCLSFFQRGHLFYRLFTDVGYTHFSDPTPGEKDATLVGAGVGMEYTYKRNLVLRGDFGVALKDLQIAGEKAGNCRGYLSATLMF